MDNTNDQLKQQQNRFKNVDLLIELAILGLMFISKLRKRS